MENFLSYITLIKRKYIHNENTKELLEYVEEIIKNINASLITNRSVNMYFNFMESFKLKLKAYNKEKYKDIYPIYNYLNKYHDYYMHLNEYLKTGNSSHKITAFNILALMVDRFFIYKPKYDDYISALLVQKLDIFMNNILSKNYAISNENYALLYEALYNELYNYIISTETGNIEDLLDNELIKYENIELFNDLLEKRNKIDPRSDYASKAIEETNNILDNLRKDVINLKSQINSSYINNLINDKINDLAIIRSDLSSNLVDMKKIEEVNSTISDIKNELYSYISKEIHKIYKNTIKDIRSDMDIIKNDTANEVLAQLVHIDHRINNAELLQSQIAKNDIAKLEKSILALKNTTTDSINDIKSKYSKIKSNTDNINELANHVLKVENITKESTESIKSINSKLSDLEKSYNDRQNMIDEIKSSISGDILALKNNNTTTSTSIQTINSKLSDFEKSYNDVQQKIDSTRAELLREILALKNKIDTIENSYVNKQTVDDINNKIDTIENSYVNKQTVDDLEKNLSTKISTLNKQTVDDINNKIDTIENSYVNKQTVDDLEKNLSTKISTLNKQTVDDINNKIDTIENSYVNKQTVDDINNKIDTIENSYVNKQTVDDLDKNLSTKISTLTNNNAEIDKMIARLSKLYDNRQEVIDDIKSDIDSIKTLGATQIIQKINEIDKELNSFKEIAARKSGELDEVISSLRYQIIDLTSVSSPVFQTTEIKNLEEMIETNRNINEINVSNIYTNINKQYNRLIEHINNVKSTIRNNEPDTNYEKQIMNISTAIDKIDKENKRINDANKLNTLDIETNTGRLDGLVKEVDAITNKFRDLSNRISENSVKNTELGEEYKKLNTSYKDLLGKYNDFETRINTSVNKITNEYENIKDKNIADKNDITEFKKETNVSISQLTNYLEEQTDDLNTHKSTTKSTLDGIKNQIDKINSRLDRYDKLTEETKRHSLSLVLDEKNELIEKIKEEYSKDIVTIQRNYSNLEKKYNDLSTAIKNLTGSGINNIIEFMDMDVVNRLYKDIDKLSKILIRIDDNAKNILKTQLDITEISTIQDIIDTRIDDLDITDIKYKLSSLNELYKYVEDNIKNIKSNMEKVELQLKTNSISRPAIAGCHINNYMINFYNYFENDYIKSGIFNNDVCKALSSSLHKIVAKNINNVLNYYDIEALSIDKTIKYNKISSGPYSTYIYSTELPTCRSELDIHDIISNNYNLDIKAIKKLIYIYDRIELIYLYKYLKYIKLYRDYVFFITINKKIRNKLYVSHIKNRKQIYILSAERKFINKKYNYKLLKTKYSLKVFKNYLKKSRNEILNTGIDIMLAKLT